MPSLCSYVVLYIITDEHVSVPDFKFLLNIASRCSWWYTAEPWFVLSGQQCSVSSSYICFDGSRSLAMFLYRFFFLTTDHLYSLMLLSGTQLLRPNSPFLLKIHPVSLTRHYAPLMTSEVF